MIGWLRERLLPRAPHEEKFAQAMMLTNEVEQKMRERAASPDPFRALMADLFMQHHDIALITDAFEAAQEARIFQGPESS